MNTVKAKRGDTVHITPAESPKYAGDWTVVKVNPTTYGLVDSATGLKRLKASHELVHLGAGMPQVPGSPLYQVAPPTEVAMPLDTGTVVTMTGVRGVDSEKLWVITGETAKGYRLFPLGGSTRYYTGIPASRLTEVTEIDNWSK